MNELTGVVKTVFELKSGISKNNKDWATRDVLLTCGDKYPKDVIVKLFNDNARQTLKLGQEITVEYDIESREYQGRYYTDIKVFKIK